MKNKFMILGIVFIVIVIGFFLTKYLMTKDINNTEWKLTGWNVDSLSPEVSEITLKFEKDNISGNGGVNSFGGNYNIGFNKQINFTSIVSTEMASTNPDINRAESMYFSLLTEVRYYEITNNNLILKDKNKNTLLMFDRL